MSDTTCPRCGTDCKNAMIDLMQIKSDGHCQMCRAELSGKYAGLPQKPFFKASLPMPPSVNDYWHKSVKYKKPVRGVKGKPYVHVYLSARASNFRNDVIAHVADLGSIKTNTGRIKAVVTLNGATMRSFDVDNFMKGIGDALTHSRVYKDDKQIDELIVKRGEVIKGGQVSVELYEIKESKQ